MAIESFTIKKVKGKHQGLPFEEIQISFKMSKPNENPLQAEALDLLADAIKMICAQTLKKKNHVFS